MNNSNTRDNFITRLKKKYPAFFSGILVLIILFYCTVLLPEETFRNLVREDSFFEYAGATLFLLACIMSFILFFRNSAFFNPQDQQYFKHYRHRIFFLFLGVVFFVALGEEISWGQRIIGFDTPDPIKERNIQKEFNIHNLEIFHLFDRERNQKTGFKSLFTAKRMFIYLFTFYLFVIPLLVKFYKPARQLFNRLYVPIPAIELGVLFILNVLIYRVIKMANGYTGIWKYLAEVEEFNFAVILFLIPLLWIRIGPKKAIDEYEEQENVELNLQ